MAHHAVVEYEEVRHGREDRVEEDYADYCQGAEGEDLADYVVAWPRGDS